MTNITHQQAKEAEMRVTGERFCTTCQLFRKIEGGSIKVTGKPTKPIKRWQCAECANKKRRFK